MSPTCVFAWFLFRFFTVLSVISFFLAAETLVRAFLLTRNNADDFAHRNKIRARASGLAHLHPHLGVHLLPFTAVSMVLVFSKDRHARGRGWLVHPHSCLHPSLLQQALGPMIVALRIYRRARVGADLYIRALIPPYP